MTDLEAIGKTCFALHARMTARLLSRTYEAALRPLGLKLPQFGILGAIGHGTTASETVLAGKLGLERTTLVRNLFRRVDPHSLVAAQLVSTQLDADDTLRLIAAAFGLKHEDPSKAILLKRLEDHLLCRPGRRQLR